MTCAALTLRAHEVDAERGSIRGLHGKAASPGRSGSINAGAEIVLKWMLEQTLIGAAATGPLICTRSGRALSQGHVRRRVHEPGRTAWIVKRVHPHELQNTFAVELREAGLDIAVMRRQLGHVGQQTRIWYLDHLAPESVVSEMRSRRTQR